MKLLLVLLGLGALILVIRALLTRGAPPPGRSDIARPHLTETTPAAPKGPPSSGRADPLEMIRAALPSMTSEEIEHLLEMGANLKPGAEELFEEELRRRRSGEG